MPQSPSSLPPSLARPPVFRVDIPLLPESAVGNALQFIDLLRGANLLAGLRMGAQAPRMAWRLLDAGGLLPLASLPGPLAAYTPAGDTAAPSAPAHALFIPSFHAADIPAIRAVAARHRALSRQLGIALDAGQKLLTVGNGAWLAAQSGRLNGRQASLPWFYIAGFERDFPGIGHSLGRDLSDDGPWLSCALPHSVNLLAIALVRHALGEELAAACETVMAPDHQRARAALQANAQQHIPATRDSTLARAIAWMEAHLDQPYSLARLAEAASVSTRTLLRHFQQELSQSPLDYLHGLRCRRAKVMLEVTLESVPSVAVACGYADPAAFRRIFARYTGMAPAEYRKRHALRAPRRRWRVEIS
ncbi:MULTISPECIES: GlxA family transcriptional regulator [unclassified Acidovorax]|uniref:GlxA family transcriptional regulator n=1 Tax=unclassified Acidovorax TaxID=2684926 RepID=UPI001C44B821|nr:MULTISPECIES: helix-turn-helix domain-containing protein [unclassified Acidovorax]MBV7428698.1 helix-turn-helix domain-containing protein [Acidovorax sp. sif0732]MBV7450524.1 helix-turn-helix domain-containing protein [Acidovorax sp. sif0715]